MALTRDFRDTIRERAQREPAFRRSLLREGLQLINNGDFATGRAVLRNYINATIGFDELHYNLKRSDLDDLRAGRGLASAGATVRPAALNSRRVAKFAVARDGTPAAAIRLIGYQMLC